MDISEVRRIGKANPTKLSDIPINPKTGLPYGVFSNKFMIWKFGLNSKDYDTAHYWQASPRKLLEVCQGKRPDIRIGDMMENGFTEKDVQDMLK